VTSVPSTVGIVASGEDVLNDAVFWIDAGRSSVSNGALTNLGTGGSAINAVFGNTTGVDSFDPALLSHTGTNYLYLPGMAGNYASTPDSPAVSVTGDIEIIVRVALDDWTPATAQVLVGKFAGAGNISYNVNVQTPGNIQISTSTDGTATSVATSDAVPPFVNGTAYWVRVTRASASGNINFYYAADQPVEPTTWTQLGTQRSNTAGAIFDSTAVQEIGSINAGASAPAAGKFYRAIVRNGIGGTTVFDADFTTGITSGAQTTFTESSANAATVTINRATSGRKSVAVTRPILLFGTDDYLEVADNDLLDFGASDSFTAIVIVRQWATAPSFSRYIDKKNGGGTGVGWDLTTNGTASQPAFFIGDSINGANRTGSVVTAGTLNVFVGVLNRAAQTMAAFTNNTSSATTSTTSVGSLTNALPMRVGIAANIASSAADMELVAAAVWRRALNANEIATIVNRYT